MNLGLKIRRRREQLGLSQMELSKLAEIPQSRISELESGARTQMSLQNLRSMARALGVSADYLIDTWEDGEAPAPPTAAPPTGEGTAPARRRGRPRKAAALPRRGAGQPRAAVAGRCAAICRARAAKVGAGLPPAAARLVLTKPRPHQPLPCACRCSRATPRPTGAPRVRRARSHRSSLPQGAWRVGCWPWPCPAQPVFPARRRPLPSGGAGAVKAAPAPSGAERGQP